VEFKYIKGEYNATLYDWRSDMHIIVLLLCFFSTSLFAAPIIEAELQLPGYPYAPVVGDVNMDGFPEIVVGYGASELESAGLIVFQKRADNSLDTSLFHWRLPVGEVYTPYIGDIDNDGCPEICACFWRRSDAPDSIICFNHDYSVLWKNEIGAVIWTPPSIYTEFGGHEITAGDMDGDGNIEVFVHATRSKYIRIFDGATGALLHDLGGSDYGFPYDAPAIFDLDGDGTLEIISCWYIEDFIYHVRCFNTVDRTELWVIENALSFGVADVNNDSLPEIVAIELERPYFHINYYNAYGTYLGTVDSMDSILASPMSFPHFGPPMIAQFDLSTSEPEMIFWLNHIDYKGYHNAAVIFCYKFDGSLIWDFIRVHTEFMTATGADINCDSIPDIATIDLRNSMYVLDGATGAIKAQFSGYPVSGDQVNDFISIVDVDMDFHTEYVFNGRSAGWRNFVAIAGNDSRWNTTRPIWNEGGFYYSSIGDSIGLSLSLKDRSYQNWKDYNIYRCQACMACGLMIRTSDSIQCSGCETFSDLKIHANVINSNYLVPAPGSRVKIEILQGEEYMSLISGVEEIYLGDIAPADSVDAIWTYEVDGSCLWEELKVRIHTSSIDSVNIHPTYYDFRIRLPKCADFPEIVNVRPLPCNGVMTCPDTAEQTIILCVTSKYFPINYEETKLYVNDEVFTIESENMFQYDDNLVYFPSEPFENGDSIVYYLFSTTSIGCTTISPPCTVIVDLQPPMFYNEIPSNNSTVETVPNHFQALLTDSIAGVRWSSLDSSVAHFTSMYDTIDLPIILEDSSVIVQFDGLMILGHIEICFENILDDPTIEYCEPNVLDTCFRFNVEPKIAAIPVFPDSGAYNGCVDGVIKMFFNFHEYPIDLSTVILEINDSIILGIDSRLSLIDGDTLLFSPDLGFWMDSTWIDVCLRQAKDIHDNELAESPVCWGFWNDFSPPISEMIFPVRPEPIRFMDQFIDIQIEDNLSGVDTSMLEFSLDDIYYSRDQLVWIECDTGWIVRFDPILNDLSYVPDDTIKILIHVCDNVDSIYYCGPNCQDFQFFLPVMIIDECQRFPNPFTPNSDGLNDFAQFYFPDFGVKPGDIFIFDIYNKEVKEIHVPKGLDCKENARWDGTDRDGNSLPQGVYIYLIKIDGEIICQGTVSIAR